MVSSKLLNFRLDLQNSFISRFKFKILNLDRNSLGKNFLGHSEMSGNLSTLGKLTKKKKIKYPALVLGAPEEDKGAPKITREISTCSH